MVSAPTGRLEVVKVAVLVKPGPGPGTSVTGGPSDWPTVVGGNNSAKVTVPVGAAKLPVKVAVKVTSWPWVAGLGAPTRVATLLSGEMLMVTGMEVEDVWVASPE